MLNTLLVKMKSNSAYKLGLQ